MAIYSVTMVLWKETAFPLCRAMERRWKRNVVSRVSSISTIIIKDMYVAQVRKGHKCAMSAKMAVWLRNCLCVYSYLRNWLSLQSSGLVGQLIACLAWA